MYIGVCYIQRLSVTSLWSILYIYIYIYHIYCILYMFDHQSHLLSKDEKTLARCKIRLPSD